MKKFFENLFGIPPCERQYQAEVRNLTRELIRIGISDDYLSERPVPPFNLQCRHTRARQIGQRLHDLGGLALMEYAYREVRKKAGKPEAAHLEYCWAEIGRWLP